MDELAKAVAKLDAQELYLDDNSPWRIMLTRRDGWHQAIAEQYDEERGAHGDGQWGDGRAICEIVNAAIKLLKGS